MTDEPQAEQPVERAQSEPRASVQVLLAFHVDVSALREMLEQDAPERRYALWAAPGGPALDGLVWYWAVEATRPDSHAIIHAQSVWALMSQRAWTLDELPGVPVIVTVNVRDLPAETRAFLWPYYAKTEVPRA